MTDLKVTLGDLEEIKPTATYTESLAFVTDLFRGGQKDWALYSSEIYKKITDDTYGYNLVRHIGEIYCNNYAKIKTPLGPSWTARPLIVTRCQIDKDIQPEEEDEEPYKEIHLIRGWFWINGGICKMSLKDGDDWTPTNIYVWIDSLTIEAFAIPNPDQLKSQILEELNGEEKE